MFQDKSQTSYGIWTIKKSRKQGGQYFATLCRIWKLSKLAIADRPLWFYGLLFGSVLRVTARGIYMRGYSMLIQKVHIFYLQHKLTQRSSSPLLMEQRVGKGFACLQ